MQTRQMSLAAGVVREKVIEPDMDEVDAILSAEKPFFDFSAVRAAHEQEHDEAEVFYANAAQCRFRSAYLTGKYEEMIAAGTISSSKTYGIAALIVDLAMQYPETHVLVVRARREQLVDNTIPDFIGIIPPWVFEQNPKAYNRSRLDITLPNGSKIQFRQSNEQNDPHFAWLKGKKVDILFVDECDGMSREFIGMAKSRVGVKHKRSRADMPTCPPVTFLACNPNISWPKEYYTLAIHRPEALEAQKAYFQVFTIQDNKEHITPEKLAAWKRQFTPPMFKRFVEGSWDAMADREQLFLYEYMDKCRKVIDVPAAAPYSLGVDPARYGPDKCAFLIMHGPNLHRLEFLEQSNTGEIEERILKLMSEFNITPGRVTVDNGGGIGAGVIDNLGQNHKIWVNSFLGADAAPRDPDLEHVNFINKRAWLFWKVMLAMRDGLIGGIDTLGWQGDTNIDEVLRQDLASIHYHFSKSGKAMQIEDKEEIKKRLHRSPDFADVLCYVYYSYILETMGQSMEVVY